MMATPRHDASPRRGRAERRRYCVSADMHQH
jgi:hypothetical protein